MLPQEAHSNLFMWVKSSSPKPPCSLPQVDPRTGEGFTECHGDGDDTWTVIALYFNDVRDADHAEAGAAAAAGRHEGGKEGSKSAKKTAMALGRHLHSVLILRVKLSPLKLPSSLM